MSFTYAIPDIHGHFDMLLRGLDFVSAHSGDARDADIVFLGDYVDRGPQSREVVELLMDGPENWICLMGNHEQMMIDAYDYGERGNWLHSGGKATYNSFAPGGVTEKHLEWLRALHLYHEDKHRVYVHAGVPLDTVGTHATGAFVPLAEQSANELLWHRYVSNSDHGWRDKHVVHGHTPQKHGPECLRNRTNLDCGAVYGGPLAIGVFDDDVPGGPVEVLKVEDLDA
jgi:serine/threonine protein phosphatase 1